MKHSSVVDLSKEGGAMAINATRDQNQCVVVNHAVRQHHLYAMSHGSAAAAIMTEY